ncbi:uncharacterized protein MJAP1_004165 [Malassezia japonica]|uniref:NADH dehydrogenase [ubiquinone] 1 alpha subcomplex subunit 13 n=1 Tax=Malassezia japonica TaxID=223818 RepID=A0AAF0F1P4_9BASI|nr:uncharacterized protein MJAP1_004165 [Malassezia japonica]WFD41170.1 hypothetical protein MJAP1_004165 [Malassezia japonica]
MSQGVGYKQDLPPRGGFAPIRYKRNIPTKGPSGVALLSAVAGLTAFGFYRVGQNNIEKRELARERAWSRIHLTPLLLAESDRDTFRREKATLLREKELMKDVKGWEVRFLYSQQAGKSVYNTKRYTPNSYVVM